MQILCSTSNSINIHKPSHLSWPMGLSHRASQFTYHAISNKQLYSCENIIIKECRTKHWNHVHVLFKLLRWFIIDIIITLCILTVVRVFQFNADCWLPGGPKLPEAPRLAPRSLHPQPAHEILKQNRILHNEQQKNWSCKVESQIWIELP